MEAPTLDWRTRLQPLLGNQAVLRAVRSAGAESADHACDQSVIDLHRPREEAAQRMADSVVSAADDAAVRHLAHVLLGDHGRAAPPAGRSGTETMTALSSQGEPLPEHVRSSMEARFNTDFSGVRLHVDETADGLARMVNADAFTVGQHIAFASGRYAPDTAAGTRLLAHELTHTIQQRGATAAVQRAPRGSTATPAVNDGPLESRVEQLELESKRARNKSQAIFYLDSFREQVMRRATSWQRAVLRVGSAYSIAAEQHRSTLEKQAKLESLGDQVLFSILTVATAGGLAWLSSALQAGQILTEGKLLTNILEDTMQAAGGEGFSAIGTMLTTPVVSPVGINPQVFQNERLDAILAAEEHAHAYFAKVSDAFHNAPPAFWDIYDEARQKDQFDAWLDRADFLKGEENLPDTASMAFELERAFWAQWVQQLAIRALGFAPSVFGYGKQTPSDPYNITKYSYPGRAVEARLNELRISQEAGIDDFGWWTSETEIDKLVAWGRAYRVNPFVPDGSAAEAPASSTPSKWHPGGPLPFHIGGPIPF